MLWLQRREYCQLATHNLSAYSHLLRAGEVVVAVHAINASRTTSGDFAIDVELTADRLWTCFLRPLTRYPIENSVVSDPLRLTVYFSEPVSGVTALMFYATIRQPWKLKKLRPVNIFSNFQSLIWKRSL